MGKLEAFKIRLASGHAVYNAGDVISGDLLLRLTKPMIVRGIKVSFTGKAKVHWIEEEYQPDDQQTIEVEYKESQELFKKSIYVFGNDSDDDETSIPEGEHVFPFSYQLPSHLPTSYEDDIACIRYCVKAKIDKPNKDKKSKKVVTVLSTLDLNTVPDAAKPAKGSETTYLCCLCCKSGPISVEFQANRRAYVPGEFLIVDAEFKNKSSSKIKETSFSLMQKVSYYADGKTKITHNTIAKLVGPECPKHKTINWTNEKIQIPPLPPTDTTLCKFLNIEYYLIFQGHLRTCAIDLREYEDIIIGTVPIKSLDIYQKIADQPPIEASDPDQVTLPSAVEDEQHDEPQQQHPTIKALPTLTYKAGIADAGGAVNLAAKDDNGDKSYSPQYTFYDWSQPEFDH